MPWRVYVCMFVVHTQYVTIHDKTNHNIALDINLEIQVTQGDNIIIYMYVYYNRAANIHDFPKESHNADILGEVYSDQSSPSLENFWKQVVELTIHMQVVLINPAQ